MRKLKTSISEKSLLKYIYTQVNNIIPDNNKVDKKNLEYCLKVALERIELSFSVIKNKYYYKNNLSFFNHLNADHYSALLYFISNNAYKINDVTISSKFFLLNKFMFGVDVFYKVELPSHFIFVHPLGTILGNAKYEDFLVVYQNVTVGSTTDGFYPNFSKKTILYSNSSLIGKSKIGENFILAANSSLINKNIGKNKIVKGAYPNNSISNNKKSIIKNYFDI